MAQHQTDAHRRQSCTRYVAVLLGTFSFCIYHTLFDLFMSSWTAHFALKCNKTNYACFWFTMVYIHWLWHEQRIRSNTSSIYPKVSTMYCAVCKHMFKNLCTYILLQIYDIHYMYVHTITSIWTYMYMYMYMYMHMHTHNVHCIHKHLTLQPHNILRYFCIHEWTCTYTYTNIHVYVLIDTLHTYIETYVHMCTNLTLHRNIHINIYCDILLERLYIYT